jgi:hypothetical protein
MWNANHSPLWFSFCLCLHLHLSFPEGHHLHFLSTVLTWSDHALCLITNWLLLPIGLENHTYFDPKKCSAITTLRNTFPESFHPGLISMVVFIMLYCLTAYLTVSSILYKLLLFEAIFHGIAKMFFEWIIKI